MSESSLGTLITELFKVPTEPLISVCAAHILVEMNTSGTLSMLDYPNDGLFVKSNLPNYTCYGDTADLASGKLHLIVNSK